MILRTLTGCCIAILLTAAAFADEPPSCLDPQTQVELTYCASVDYESADADLNALWPDIVAAAKTNDEYVADMIAGSDVPTTLEALRTAQRAWIKYRDAQCEYEAYEVFGGTAQPMVGSLCLARLTRERIEVLSQTLDMP
ncbi:lysozyme inhibitor LprI family protein [Hoeflea sp. YIM 152468]|uniref:lysozyme inhibitor LprI family protein n=1 Tax=Hoeflea sp. YIM 152468 TaxID=3031759 RepID=UPI0023DAA399|nr:lysozyme inhibitor LprI family protein [Hoeflea sp. YIM 152468]MDF1606663.1 lysozyme inhibitor LprI family protein [Hoeflea sp. YIM 152468]